MRVMANAATGSASQRDQSSTERRVWLAAYLTVGLGAIAAVTAFWRSADMVGLVVGLLSLLTGMYAQMLSTETNQRWLAVVGAIAGGFGMGMGIGHGAL